MTRESNLEQRRWAMHALTRVLSDTVMLDEALSEVPAEFRSWVHEVVAGALRWKGRLDGFIDQLSLKKKPSGSIRKVLLLATYQLLNQPQVPRAWIVSETVDFVRQKEGESASRFVNALLRRISEHADSYRSASWPEKASDQELAAWASMPEWMWKRVVRDHGWPWAKAFAESCLERPQFWVRSAQVVPDAQPGAVPESWKLDHWRAVHETDEYRAGTIFVQDISSQILIAEFTEESKRLLGEIRGASVLDLCAAPGGKSSGLACNGWKVTATDRQADTKISQERYRLLQDTARRIAPGLKGGGLISVVDRKEVETLKNFDAVWVDAPCTGSGLLRRHPEVRWIKDERTLESLRKEQVSLLREASTKVKSGGLLMFTVCSVLRKDECDLIVQSAELTGFEKVREWTLSPHLEPFGDGFSGVLLRRS